MTPGDNFQNLHLLPYLALNFKKVNNLECLTLLRQKLLQGQLSAVVNMLAILFEGEALLPALHKRSWFSLFSVASVTSVAFGSTQTTIDPCRIQF